MKKQQKDFIIDQLKEDLKLNITFISSIWKLGSIDFNDKIKVIFEYLNSINVKAEIIDSKDPDKIHIKIYNDISIIRKDKLEKIKSRINEKENNK